MTEDQREKPSVTFMSDRGQVDRLYVDDIVYATGYQGEWQIKQFDHRFLDNELQRWRRADIVPYDAKAKGFLAKRYPSAAGLISVEVFYLRLVVFDHMAAQARFRREGKLTRTRATEK